jgi:hypothetical protein
MIRNSITSAIAHRALHRFPVIVSLSHEIETITPLWYDEAWPTAKTGLIYDCKCGYSWTWFDSKRSSALRRFEEWADRHWLAFAVAITISVAAVIVIAFAVIGGV